MRVANPDSALYLCSVEGMKGMAYLVENEVCYVDNIVYRAQANRLQLLFQPSWTLGHLNVSDSCSGIEGAYFLSLKRESLVGGLELNSGNVNCPDLPAGECRDLPRHAEMAKQVWTIRGYFDFKDGVVIHELSERLTCFPLSRQNHQSAVIGA